MTKQHLKALNTPRTWNVARHATTFVTRPNAGAHSLTLGISLNHILVHELGLTTTAKESQLIINKKACLVNGVVATDIKHNVGFMDVVSFPELKKSFRVTINKRGKLTAIEIAEKEAKQKLSKVMNKIHVKKGGLMYTTLDGRTIPGDAKVATGSTLVLEVPGQKVVSVLPLEKGSRVMLIGGKHVGSLGVIETITDTKVFFKSLTDDQTYETLKTYVYVTGKDKDSVQVQ